MRIIAAILGIMVAVLLVTGTVSALDIYGNADADADVNVDVGADAQARSGGQVDANAEAESDADVGFFARIAAFFTGDADNETLYDFNRTNSTDKTYNETDRNESNVGFWANVKAFLNIG